VWVNLKGFNVMGMKIKKHNVRRLPILFISGDVSGEESMVLSDELRQVCQGDSRCVVVDLGDTVAMDSSAMGVIIYWWKNLKQQSRQLVLCNPHDAVLELLVTTNLDKLIKVIDSVEGFSGEIT